MLLDEGSNTIFVASESNIAARQRNRSLGSSTGRLAPMVNASKKHVEGFPQCPSDIFNMHSASTSLPCLLKKPTDRNFQAPSSGIFCEHSISRMWALQMIFGDDSPTLLDITEDLIPRC